jgi:hypothetical protein
MLKATKNGVQKLGKSRKELSVEDREFIHQMFQDFSDFEKPFHFVRDTIEDELYEDL